MTTAITLTGIFTLAVLVSALDDPQLGCVPPQPLPAVEAQELYTGWPPPPRKVVVYTGCQVWRNFGTPIAGTGMRAICHGDGE